MFSDELWPDFSDSEGLTENARAPRSLCASAKFSRNACCFSLKDSICFLEGWISPIDGLLDCLNVDVLKARRPQCGAAATARRGRLRQSMLSKRIEYRSSAQKKLQVVRREHVAACRSLGFENQKKTPQNSQMFTPRNRIAKLSEEQCNLESVVG